MDDYRHVSWTDETYLQVAEALKAAIPYKQVMEMLISETRDEKMKALLSNGQVSTSSDAPFTPKVESNASDDFFSTSSDSMSVSQETVSDSDSSLEADEYDDIFKNL